MNDKTQAMELQDVYDLSFSDYTERQFNDISFAKINERAFITTPAGHFLFANDSWSPLPYEGFAVVSLINSNPGNEKVAALFNRVQLELSRLLYISDAYYFLPAESLHQTIANTLSAGRFEKQIINTGNEEAFPKMVSLAFQQIPSPSRYDTLDMKMVGLSIFGTAIVMLGIFDDGHDYEQITQFRSGFYSDPVLSQVGVTMTRPFIGHVTLAYIEKELTLYEKDMLANAIIDINKALTFESNYFKISNTELVRYHNLAEFVSGQDFPRFSFISI